jgi:hypothetical protein
LHVSLWRRWIGVAAGGSPELAALAETVKGKLARALAKVE